MERHHIPHYSRLRYIRLVFSDHRGWRLESRWLVWDAVLWQGDRVSTLLSGRVQHVARIVGLDASLTAQYRLNGCQGCRAAASRTRLVVGEAGLEDAAFAHV